MNKKDGVRRTADALRRQGVRKTVHLPKHTFHISDDDNNSYDFEVKGSDKGVYFVNDDVEVIINALLDEIEDALLHGEEIRFGGYLTISLVYMPEHQILEVKSRKPITIPGRYVPKVFLGSRLRNAIKLFNKPPEGSDVDEDIYDICDSYDFVEMRPEDDPI